MGQRPMGKKCGAPDSEPKYSVTVLPIMENILNVIIFL